MLWISKATGLFRLHMTARIRMLCFPFVDFLLFVLFTPHGLYSYKWPDSRSGLMMDGYVELVYPIRTESIDRFWDLDI